jgi:cell division protein FtsI/penicillin-binding protein 2
LLTVRQCFAKSSNIGFSKIALQLGPEKFYRYVTNFGFGRYTGLPFLSETPGRIDPPRMWSTMTLTRAAFGQGVSVSQLQMAIPFCVVANDGRLMRPLLVNRIEPARRQPPQRFPPTYIRSVILPRTAREVKDALKAVASRDGTGASAMLDHYSAAVKTGTAQKYDRNGYVMGRYYSSMIGFFPADTPQIVLAVALDEPQHGYYASDVVGPVFRSIAEEVAACLGIPPDKSSRPLVPPVAQQLAVTGQAFR